MFKQGLEGKYFYKTYFNCFVLSFLAGNVNAGGFMACGRFVTHVTGFATLFGIDMASGNLQLAIGMMSVPLYFLLGAMISAFLIDRRLKQGKPGLYHWVMALMVFCYLVASIGGQLGYFGIFGDGINLRQDYILLALLCGASGLQNASITTFSGSVVRTTHLTGITTDLGIGLVHLFFPSPERENYTKTVRANWLRVVTIAAFMLGSIAGAYLFLEFQYKGFFVPALISTYGMFATWQKKE